MGNPFIAAIDFFVPDTHTERGLKIRARLFVAMLFFSISRLSLGLVMGVISGDMPLLQTQLFVLYIFLQIGFLVFVKRFKQVEWAAFVCLCLVSFFVTVEVAFKAKSIAYSSFQLYPTMLVVAFVTIVDSRKRWAMFVVNVALSVTAVLIIKSRPVDLSYSFDAPNFAYNYLLSMNTRIAVLMAFMVIFTKIKDMAVKDLDDELESRVNAAKLLEMSSLTQSLFPDLAEPLRRFKADVIRLQDLDEERVPEALASLRGQLERMKNLASSISWIYRAYRGDQLGRAPSPYLKSQLAYLLERKLIGTGIEFRTTLSQASFDLGGPIPTVFLLQLKVLEQVLAKAKLLPELGIEFAMSRGADGKSVSFELVWFEGSERSAQPLTKELEFRTELFSEEFIREETIRELIRASGARLVENRVGSRSSISIVGDWLIVNTNPRINGRRGSHKG